MKNILIIRSANYDVIDILINQIYENNKRENVKIYFLIQLAAIEVINKRIPEAKFFSLPVGNINYKRFKSEKGNLEKINKIQYDEIYIPSSYENFNNFEEVKLIASKINKGKVLLFNRYGKVIEERLSFFTLYLYYKILFPLRYIVSVFTIGTVYVLALLYHFIRYHLLRIEI